MPRIILPILFLCCSQMGKAQSSNEWYGKGEYLPGEPITTVMKKMAAEKKLIFRVAPNGNISGKLVTAYNRSKAVIPIEGDEQHFSIAGRYNAAKALLLLIITHFRSKPDVSESYLTFNKPDSIYYDLSSVQVKGNIVTTGIANKLLNKNTTAEWVGSFMGGGLGMNVRDMGTHILPLRIRFENSGPVLAVTNTVKTSSPDIAVSAAKTTVLNLGSLIRETKIQRTIVLDTSFVKFDLYDNGEIDGDIATLILDGKPIITKQLLSTQPATIYLNLSKTKDHTLELFADNLGSIPPNTALLILTCKKKRYEINLSSNETYNGAVKLVFKSD